MNTSLSYERGTELSNRPKGLFVLDREMFSEIYGSGEIAEINSLVDIYAPVQTRKMIYDNPAILQDAQIVFSGWGIADFDDKVLPYIDNLKVIFYGAGSVKHFFSSSLWERGIRVSSAAVANAVPVAEYALGHILTGLKRSWYYSSTIKQQRTFRPSMCEVPGGYHSTVGLVSLGTIASILCKHLNAFDIDVIAYDPYVTSEAIGCPNVNMAGMEEVFSTSDIVSLHAPLTDETNEMITGEHFLMMKYGSTFINTARGALVREQEMIEVLRKRTDITAVLDVTNPEPPRRDSMLYDLPNVVLTPHVAGAMGAERKRLGRFVVDELRRYLSGKPLKGEVRQEMLAIQA